MLSVIKSSNDIQMEIANSFKKTRLLMNFSRTALSLKTGIPASTIKYFETTGNISLHTLIDLSKALNKVNDLNDLIKVEYRNNKELKNNKRERGRN